PEALAAARLPLMLASCLARHPGQTRAWLAYLRERYAGGALARKLYRLLPFIGKEPDVTHLEFATLAEEFGELIPLLPGRKVISCRGADIDILPRGRPALAAAIRAAFDRVDAVHCVSRAMVRSTAEYGLDPDKAFVNHPSIDWRYFQPTEPARRRERFTVLTVARLHWKKGIRDALRALRQVHERGVAAHYVVVGEGEDREAIQFDIWDQGLSDYVTLAGTQPRSAVREAMAEADVFLLPSVSEGLSNAALEAMAMRVPVVTTDAGGMPEVVRHGIEGFVVARRDAGQMAHYLAYLAQNEPARSAMGYAARARVQERFGIDTQIRIFESVYRSLANGGTVCEGAATCGLT
ncbi:MAG TPA: glycosyltransferase family 4 protein, partial [Armatimonadota bacterium]|nr:glycosyltransferase family 4 protein [Armatimonadota bacterium]